MTVLRPGFTLIELLVVVGIMGIMGTISVGGYHAMRRGMEDRGVVQNASEFIRSAYVRAVVDRQPVKVIFWNETVRTDDDDDGVRVLAHCVAVRRRGRFSKVDGRFLVDEFGDLSDMRYVNADGEFDPDDTSYQQAGGPTIYKMNGTGCKRSTVSSTTAYRPQTDWLMSIPGKKCKIPVYAYYVKDYGTAGSWSNGDSYGFEFADLTLTQNYIVGGNYSTSLSEPETDPIVIEISPNGDMSPSSVQISAIVIGKTGQTTTQSIGSTENPKGNRQ